MYLVWQCSVVNIALPGLSAAFDSLEKVVDCNLLIHCCVMWTSNVVCVVETANNAANKLQFKFC